MDKSVFINTVLHSIAFKVLSIYCSIMYIINIINIIIVYHKKQKKRPHRNMYQKCDHKGKIARNQTISFNSLVTYWMILEGLLSVKKLTSN